MRLIGVILVLLGALALGYHGFGYVAQEPVVEGAEYATGDRTHTIWVPPVAGGIAVVSGLLLVASDYRRGGN